MASINLNTKKLQIKLKAVAKHVEALANELEEIDKAWMCDECGSLSYTGIYMDNQPGRIICDECGTHYVVGEMDEKNNQTTNQSDKQTI